MTKDPEILEILDNWTEKEINTRIAELQLALHFRETWNAMTRQEKDEAWRKAEK